jgi:hypothetical protein
MTTGITIYWPIRIWFKIPQKFIANEENCYQITAVEENIVNKLFFIQKNLFSELFILYLLSKFLQGSDRKIKK